MEKAYVKDSIETRDGISLRPELGEPKYAQIFQEIEKGPIT